MKDTIDKLVDIDNQSRAVINKCEEKEENLNFETAMKQLEEIANQLEKNDLDLDKAVEKFEEGMKLSKKCSEILENAEKKITILINDGKDNFSEEEFNTNKE